MVPRKYRSELFQNIYEKGVAAGKARAEARAKARGEARGMARGLLLILAARGIPVSARIRKTILACTNRAALDRWIDHAVVASTAAEIVPAPTPVRQAAKRTARKPARKKGKAA